jgi:hypothetical protein
MFYSRCFKCSKEESTINYNSGEITFWRTHMESVELLEYKLKVREALKLQKSDCFKNGVLNLCRPGTKFTFVLLTHKLHGYTGIKFI